MITGRCKILLLFDASLTSIVSNRSSRYLNSIMSDFTRDSSMNYWLVHQKPSTKNIGKFRRLEKNTGSIVDITVNMTFVYLSYQYTSTSTSHVHLSPHPPIILPIVVWGIAFGFSCPSAKHRVSYLVFAGKYLVSRPIHWNVSRCPGDLDLDQFNLNLKWYSLWLCTHWTSKWCFWKKEFLLTDGHSWCPFRET